MPAGADADSDDANPGLPPQTRRRRRRRQARSLASTSRPTPSFPSVLRQKWRPRLEHSRLPCICAKAVLFHHRDNAAMNAESLICTAANAIRWPRKQLRSARQGKARCDPDLSTWSGQVSCTDISAECGSRSEDGFQSLCVASRSRTCHTPSTSSSRGALFPELASGRLLLAIRGAILVSARVVGMSGASRVSDTR